MFVIISRWLFLWVTLYLTGRRVIATHTDIDSQEKSWHFFISVWVGIAILTLYLQLISLFFPLGEKIVLIIWLLISMRSFYKERNRYKLLMIGEKNKKNIVIYFLIFSIIVFIGLNFSVGRVVDYDAYLYHFNLVAWNKLYGIVPGLANLHFRLGFNSGIHLLAAFFEQGLPNGSSIFITNGFLLTTIFMQIVSLLVDTKIIVKQKIFYLLLLPFLWISLISGGAYSLSSDVAMMVMVFAWSITLIEHPDFKFIVLIQAATAVVFKLSGLMILFASLWIFFKEKKVRQLFSKKYYVFSLIILGFLIRNVILSGYLFFPNTVLKTPFQWTMPISATVGIEGEIRAWAISPGENYLEVFDQNIFQWLPNWLIRNGGQVELKILFMSLLVFFIIFSFNKNFNLQSNEKVILLGCVMSMIFWFVKAPGFRFGSGFFYLLGSLVFSIAINSIMVNKASKAIIGLLVVFLVIYLEGRKAHPVMSNWQYNFSQLEKKIDKKKLRVVENINGYLFLEPEVGDQCGNHDLLCAPYVDDIEFIDDKNLQKGFKLKLNE